MELTAQIKWLRAGLAIAVILLVLSILVNMNLETQNRLLHFERDNPAPGDFHAEVGQWEMEREEYKEKIERLDRTCLELRKSNGALEKSIADLQAKTGAEKP